MNESISCVETSFANLQSKILKCKYTIEMYEDLRSMHGIGLGMDEYNRLLSQIEPMLRAMTDENEKKRIKDALIDHCNVRPYIELEEMRNQVYINKFTSNGENTTEW